MVAPVDERRQGALTLRRMITIVAAVFGVVATVSVLAVAHLSRSLGNELDRTTEQLIDEQRIADQIVSSSYGQQLAAYRYLENPSAATLAEFRDGGAQAYRGIRKYLFRSMPLEARLRVEEIKEAHEIFEVAAQRAFDLAASGEPARARAHMVTLSRDAALLERAVQRFLAVREHQRQELRESEEMWLTRLQYASVAVAAALIVAAVMLAVLLHRRVTTPLSDLSVAVRALAAGRDDARVPPQRFAEFQLLGTAFNEMAASIRQARIESQIRNADLERALADLQRAQRALVQHEKLSAVGEMLAGLAHELNNPLAGILGVAECLQMEMSDYPDPAVQELATSLVDPLVTESLRARDLVRNLLNFSREAATQLESVHLADAMNVAVGLRRHAFVQSQKRLEISVPDDLYVSAQPQKLELAIMNVVNNSLDALNTGAGTMLRIAAEREEDDVVVTFEDDGPGFVHSDRVFDPFYTTKPVGSGTGLGLSLVHKFVQEFGGVVFAESAPVRGARLVMRLRATEPAAGEEGADAARASEAALAG
ncbi:MAG TPA: HAMP domain-containing sensor histidine kinase [Gemmatimonadaceae bacterium]